MTAVLAALCAGAVGATAARLLSGIRPSARNSPSVFRNWDASGPLPAAALALLCAGTTALTAVTSDLARLPGELFLTVVVVTVSAADLFTGRLPNVLVLPSLVGALLLVVSQEILDPTAGSLLTALTCSLSLGVLFTGAALAAPDRMGMGDGRFLAVCALVVGYGGAARVGVLLLALGLIAAALHGVALIRLRPGPVPLGGLVALASLIALWCPDVGTLPPSDVLTSAAGPRP